jgi:hypothetical protein
MKYRLFILFVFISFSFVFAQTEKEKVLSTVTKDAIEGHIYFLADDLLKGRETGTPEAKIAASYLANTLRSYGVKTLPGTQSYFQEVYLQKTSPPRRLTLTLDGNLVKTMVALKTSEMNYSEDAIFLNYGLETDYKGKEVQGKLVIVKGGGPDSKDTRAAFRLIAKKMELAKKAGAIGIIELMQTDDTIWGFIDHNFNADQLSIASEEQEVTKEVGFVYLWLQDVKGDIGNEMELKSAVKIRLLMEDKSVEPVVSQNVVGMVEGSDSLLKNEFIIYSAHYDHVGIGTPDDTGDVIYNGARDNAVGTTTVLSMAQNLVKFPTKRSALFILFTGEEKGLLGSGYYVDHPLLPLSQMVYCFNSDNAGYNDTSVATIIGLERTTAAQHIKNAAMTFGLTAIDDPAPEQGLFDRSDNVHFAKKGIPSPTYSLGFRSFDGDVTKYYHRPGDEADNLDYDYLYKFFSSYVLAGRLIGNDSVTPTWTIGDVYENAGELLYTK